MGILWRAQVLILCAALAMVAAACGCEVERRRTDAELGLDSQQASGRHLYDQYCDRCHAPYSSRKRHGPSLQQVFQRPYLSASGMPANDDRVSEIIRVGRGKMQGFGNVLTDQQVHDLVAYLHTL